MRAAATFRCRRNILAEACAAAESAGLAWPPCQTKGGIMQFELKDVLGAVGPTASLVFASWIFMTFLQARYSAAYERYRDMIEEFRTGKDTRRRELIGNQIKLYRKRVEQMRWATSLGLWAAILLLLALISGALDAVFKGSPVLKYVGLVGTVAGLSMVIGSATLVILENTSIKRAMDEELKDVPELEGTARS
ncbi:DUF2721 domain-containing protein [Pseudoduganella umbonata]|uniref:DUF2721 domain-containing protein n=2 Tax=Pseudoduganella umbonata TaxID=864828 RepID=A0ABX5UQ22_9BURK|nr:DUF2721 domain-containing protein [Pseudoduganella umbonata]